MSINSPGERFCYLCDAVKPEQCICIKKSVSVGIEEAINETHAHIKTAVAKRNEEEYKRIWNAAINAAQAELAEKFVAPDVVIEIIGRLKK